MTQRVKRSIVAILVGCLHISLQAASGMWTGSDDGAWSDTSNWQSGVVPADSSSYADLAAQGNGVTISNDLANLQLYMIRQLGGNYTVVGNTLTTAGTTTTPGYGIYADAGTLTFLNPLKISRATRLWTLEGATVVTKGPITYNGSQYLVKYGAGEWIVEGAITGNPGVSDYLGVTEGILRLRAGADVKLFSGVNSVGNFGYNGTSGGVIIEAGAEMSLPAFVIGNANNSTGSLAVVGGKLVAHLAGESSLSIIGNSCVGSMTVTDGAEVVVSNRLTIGVQDKGSLEIDRKGAMTVGRLTLGNILNDASANKGYSIVTVGSGSLKVTDQMVWRAAGAQQRTNIVSVGKGVGGGGLLALPATVRSAVNQSWARLTVDGGVILFNGLNDSSYDATLDDYLYGLDEFWVGRAGVTINTSNFNATVTQVLKAAPAGGSRGGGFTKVGAGRLTLAGGLECTGPVTVGEGVLRLQGVEPTGVVNLLGDGGLSLVDGAYGEFAPAKVVAGQSGAAYVELEAGDGGACDSLWLSVGSQLGVVEFSLVALNDTASYWLPGEYVVVRYEGSAPQISSWYAAVPHGISATFEVQDGQKQVVLRVVKTLEGAAQWLAPGSGAWNDDGNWSYLPANDPGTKVVFSDIAKENSQVTLANQVTLGGMVIDSPWSYTFSGQSLMFGATGVAGLLDIKRGAHTLQTELVAHDALTIAARPGVALALQDRVTGSGSLAVKGGCDLIVDDISSVETPLSFDDVAVRIKSSGSFDEALNIQKGGLRLTADSGSTLAFTAAVTGVGELVKSGSNIIALEDVAGLTAPITLRSGTLELSNFPDGTLVLGEGTLRYKGESTVFNHDIIISTTLATQATTFESDADVVVNGNVYTNIGSFIKTGSGTLTFAAPGVNVFGNGNLSGSTSKQCLNWGPYGESPTKGFVQAAIVNGKVVLGCEGQYNRFVQTLTIGAESTMAPGAETAAHLEINGGETVGGWFALGRGNGSAITAPEGLESTLRVNGGSLNLAGLWLGLRNDDMESVTARPLFEMNGGEFVCRDLTIGSERPGNARPRLVFNGGTTTFTGTGEVLKLAYGGGTESEMVIAGGTVSTANGLLYLVHGAEFGSGTLRLNGGRYTTRGFAQSGFGEGLLYFNGGTMVPIQSMVLAGVTRATIEAGGLVTEVPEGLTLTIEQTLEHDESLVGADGGIVKSGAGTLILAGAQEYTGSTVISNGTLQISGTLAVTNLSLAGGSVLSLCDGALEVFAPTALAVGDGSGPGVIEMEIAANGSGCDQVALPASFDGTILLRLFRQGSRDGFVKPGRYPLFTFTGSAPSTSGWVVEQLQSISSFEVDGTTIYLCVGPDGGNTAISEWVSSGSGAWGDAFNWSQMPLNSAVASALFGGYLEQATTVDTDSGVNFGYLVVDTPHALDFSGGAVTLGDSSNGATIIVTDGAHKFNSELIVPASDHLVIDAGASVALNGGVSGAGELNVSGGGSLQMYSGDSCEVPLKLSGATLAANFSGTWKTPLVIGAGGATITSATGEVVAVEAEISGTGTLCKRGSSVLEYSGAKVHSGETVLQGGTLVIDTPLSGALTLGDGTLKYVGSSAIFTNSIKVQTTTANRATTFDADVDVTFSGVVTAESGAFIKRGSGTLTIDGLGENVLNASQLGVLESSRLPNYSPYGDAPTLGFRGFNIFDGKVVMGRSGQTNIIYGSLLIGAYTTDDANSEKSGCLEINGGYCELLANGYFGIGRGNGTLVTAPDGLESCLTINDGEIHCAGITLGQGMRDFGTVTGRPKFILNGGTVNIKELYCGEYLTEATPYIEINGGELRVQNKGIQLSTTGECKTEMVINGGLVEIDAGGVLNLVTAGSMGGAHLKLAGGRLIAAGFVVGSSNATATILFDGGVFQPTASTILSTTIATTVTTGGANFDVPQGVDYTVASPLLHDPELGAAIDGGVVKSGLGSLSLTGINSYTGDTVVQAGGVSISGCSEFVSVLEVAPGAKLALVAPVQGTFTLSELTLGDANGPEAELSITATRLQLQTGAVIIGGTLTLGKAYVSVVEAESGQTVAVNGSYVIVAGASAISGAAEDLIFKNPAYGKRYEFVVDGNQLLLNVATVTDGATIWNHNFGGSWDDLDKWVVAPDVGAPGMKIGFLDAITTPAAITLTHEAVAGELLFDNSTPYTLAGAGSLSLESTNGVANLNVAQGAHTVDVAVELTDEVRAEVASGAKLSISGAIAGEGAVVKGGSGTLSLVGANSYSGGTTVNGGSVEVAGVQPLGGGAVNFNEGAIATVVGAAATVPNDVTVAKSMDIVTQAPLTLGGIWNASAPTLFSKKGTNELIIAGNMRFDAGATSRLAIDDGQVVFASGSTAQFYSTGVRNSIDFTTPTATSVVRRLRFESGAKVTADCLYVGYGATNSVEMNGGNLNLLGFGSNNDAFLLGGKREAYSEFTVTGGSLFAADNSWTLLGFESENTVVRMLGGVVSLGRVSLGVRDDAGNNVGNRAQNLWLNMQGGLLEARQGWNWMAEQNGVRLNVVNLMGGTLRLPPTYAATTNRINQSRVIFNGGTLQARGGSTLYPQEFLAGVKQAYVGSDHAIIDTSAYNLAIEQRLMPLDGSSGGVVKRGTGVLALRRPGVEGLLEVEAGTLRLTPEAGGLIPDAPMLRLSFEDGILNEESACKQSLNLLGSINNVVLVDGARGERAARFNGSHVIQVGYRSDMAGVDSYTISAWVRQSAYGGVNTARTFFGNLINYSQTAHEFLLRVLGGDYRMIITGNDNYAYGNLYMDVVGAVPLNHWVMLSLVVDGTNGLSMYVNGEKRTMRINFNGVVTYSDTYGAGKRWLLQPPARTSGKAFMIGSVAANDTAGFIGDIDDVTMYSRALNEAEMELLYTSQVAAPRVCVKEGAKLDLAATTQQVRELSGTGLVGGGEVVVTERLNPGDSPESAPGAWLGIDGSLVLGTNVTYVCDWQAEENDIVEVAKTLTVDGRGFISLGLTDKSQMPGSPRVKSFPVMYYGEIVGAENFAQWEVVDVGRKVDAQIVAADGVVSIRLEVRSGMVLMLR